MQVVYLFSGGIGLQDGKNHLASKPEANDKTILFNQSIKVVMLCYVVIKFLKLFLGEQLSEIISEFGGCPILGIAT